MTVFDILTLLGGLSLFLFGMNVMGQALERRAGGGLRVLLGRLTSNRFAGFLTGLAVTAVIQSSSATTVMVVGFVNSGLMTLRQAISVIMGANVGTTVTAWILSLSGISSESFFIRLLKPSSFTPVLALIGIALYMMSKSSKKKDVGTILLGFATLMFGMETMSGSVAGLANVPEFRQLFVAFENPLLGMLAGAVLTAIIQSSSASVGILQALAVTGQVSYGAAIPIIMGQNIGTCITSLLSAVGTTKNAKRTALVHLAFNVIGTGVWITVFMIIKAVFAPALLGEAASLFGIAVAHSAFNILCTLLLFPAAGLLERIVVRLVPDSETPEALEELDERLLATPSVALARCRDLANRMAECSVGALKKSIDAIENYTPSAAKEIRELEERSDKYEDLLGSYLVKLSTHPQSDSDNRETAMLLKAIGDLERISDHSVNILCSVEEMREKKYEFSDAAKKELSVLTSAVYEIVELSLSAFAENDLASAASVEPLEQVVDGLRDKLRSSHIKRLQEGACSIEIGFVWSDLLTNLSRTSDHCSNIAGEMIDCSLNTMNIHESLRSIKNGEYGFNEKFQMYSEKYSLE